MFRIIRHSLTPRRKPRTAVDPAAKNVTSGCLVFVCAPLGLACLVVAVVMIVSFCQGQPMDASRWIGVGVLLLIAAVASWLTARWINTGR